MAIRAYAHKKSNITYAEALEIVRKETLDSIQMYTKFLEEKDSEFFKFYKNPEEEFSKSLEFHNTFLKDLDSLSEKEIFESLPTNYHVSDKGVFEELTHNPLWRGGKDVELYSLKETVEYFESTPVGFYVDINLVYEFWEKYPDGCIIMI